MHAPMDLSTSVLLDVIKPQPDDQREFLVLLSYIRAATDAIVTVYPGLDLRTYLEIPRHEIIWAEKAVPGQASSPTKLVIHAKAQVRRVTTIGQTVEAGFLSGMITSACLPGSAPGVTLNVSVENEAINPIPQCPGPRGTQAHGATAAGSSTLRVTGACIDDGSMP